MPCIGVGNSRGHWNERGWSNRECTGDDKNDIMDRAEAQFREALRRDPHHAGFLTTLADIILEKGNVVEAGMLCRRAIYFEPTNYVGFASLGHVYKAMDDLTAAIHCYEKSITLREHPDVITNLVSVFTCMQPLRILRKYFWSISQVSSVRNILIPMQSLSLPHLGKCVFC